MADRSPPPKLYVKTMESGRGDGEINIDLESARGAPAKRSLNRGLDRWCR